MRDGLVAACDDRQLFGFGLWPRQRELLDALERGPRTHVWAVGRRSGKTTLGALAGVHNCLLRPDLDAMVRPGERRYAVAVATNLRQARLFVAAARSIVERSPLLLSLLESSSDDELVFGNGNVQKIRMRVKYTNYKVGHSDVRILDDVPDTPARPTPTPTPKP